MKEIIEINDVNISYKNNIVLSNCTFKSDKASLIAILGRNGSGKSTLLNSISGFLKPDKGNIFLSNTNVYNCNPTARAKLLSYLDSTKLYLQNITIKELIAFGRYPFIGLFASLSKKDIYIINMAIEKCNLTDYADKQYCELSDGEKQRVLIARSISQNTPFIIMDEPTSHLDFIAKKEIVQLLKNICEIEKKTILFSSHEPELCTEFADRFLITANKKLTEVTKEKVVEKLMNS